MYHTLCTAEFDDRWGIHMEELTQFTRVGFSLDKDPKSRMSERDIVATLQGYDIHVSGYEKIARRVLEQCPDLKLILSVRDGPEENIDVACCTELGIPVLSCSGRCERSVPEFILLTMLLMAKPAISSSCIIRTEGWTAGNDLKLRRICEGSRELAGKTLGIVGLGRNGRGLARRAAGFEMDIVAYDPYVSAEEAKSLGVRLCSMEALIAEADYVVMLARVTAQTRGMMSAEYFAAMKDGACFINAARAVLADNEALLKELRANRLRAALDVFDQEPLGTDAPWYTIPEERLLLTSHLAGLSVERVTYQSEKIHSLLNSYLGGETPESGIYNRDVFSSPCFPMRGGVLWGALKKR